MTEHRGNLEARAAPLRTSQRRLGLRQASRFAVSWDHPFEDSHPKDGSTTKQLEIPSGYVKIAIEHGYL